MPVSRQSYWSGRGIRDRCETEIRAPRRSGFGEITDFIAADNPVRALSFVREMRERCVRIADHPDAYPLRTEYGADVRVTVHGRYLIFHRRRGGENVIERIVHGNRHPRSVTL